MMITKDLGGTDEEISEVLDAIMAEYTGYEELEYIELLKGQHINTDITPYNHKIEFKFQALEPLSSVTDIIYTSIGNYQLTWYNNKWYYGTGSVEKQLNSTNATTLQTVIFNNDNNRISFNGTEYGEVFTPVTNKYKLQLSGAGTSRSSALRFYYVKIYDKDNAKLIMDLIPVKRVLDNKICMFDKITKQYFENVGTSGEFIAGPIK